MPACYSTSDAACRVDVRLLALAIPPLGLAPDALARADWRNDPARSEVPAQPWVWQCGTSLFVLDGQTNGSWAVAELRFHRVYGYYVERRRATYESAREAIGAALSWVLRLGDEEALTAAATLDGWCGLTFAPAPAGQRARL